MDLPVISLVTPTFNRAELLAETMASVLDQRYPRLEYIVMDGGSDDGTVEEIKRHESELAHWTSAPDEGMYDAIGRGFAKSSGEVMGWLNSDDKHTPWTLALVAEIFAALPQVEWITSMYPLVWDDRGTPVHVFPQGGFSRRAFLRGDNLPGAGWAASGWIQQESTFWRRSLWERAGGYMDTSYELAADFELWARFFDHAPLHGVETPLAGFRAHADQKTVESAEEYRREAIAVLRARGERAPGRLESVARSKVRPYLPPPAVRALSKLRLTSPRPVCAHVLREGTWQLRDR